MGRRIFQAIVSSRGGPEFNDLFLPGRMAYSIDLEADDEIPTTMIRSKADLQGIEVSPVFQPVRGRHVVGRVRS